MLDSFAQKLLCVTLAILVVSIGCGGGSQATQVAQPTSPKSVQVPDPGPHLLGTPQAKVTIIKFCDFQCPFCKSFHTETEWQILNDYVNTGKARIAYRNFPLSFHRNAEISAEAAECAASVGGNDSYWKYHDILFTRGSADGTGLDASSLKEYAAELQLDTLRFNTCLDNHEPSAAIFKDLTDGGTAGVNATPTFFVNGNKLVGAQPYSVFKSAIDFALSQ